MVLASGYTSGDLFQTTSKEQHFGARQGSHVRGRQLRCWQEEQQRSVLSFSMMVEQPNLYPLQCFGLILTLDTASSVLYKGRLSCALCNVLES